MLAFFRTLAQNLPRPEAILLISAHWQESEPTITAGANPPLIYDYYGFPPETYEITYPAPGALLLAANVHGMLREAGIEARLDRQRGFDHGMFVPLKIIYPEADIPCVQLSLQAGLDPSAHLRLGRALAGLRREKIFTIGSGFSFHNLGAFVFDGPTPSDPENEAFQNWLIETCTSKDLGRDDRAKRLAGWLKAPHARYCHPYEDHLLPLHVCCGQAGSAARLLFHDRIMGKKACALLW